MRDDVHKRSYDYKTARVVVTIVVIVFAITASVGLHFIFQDIIFGPNVVKVYPYDDHRWILPEYVFGFIYAVIAMSFFLFRTVGKAVIIRITDEKELAAEQLKLHNKNKVKDALISLLILAVAVGFLYFENIDCIGFTGEKIIVPNPNGYALEYSGLNVYQLEYISDSVGGVTDYKQVTAYVLVSDGNRYELPVVPTSSTEAEQLSHQIKKHNPNVIRVKTINDIPN